VYAKYASALLGVPRGVLASIQLGGRSPHGLAGALSMSNGCSVYLEEEKSFLHIASEAVDSLLCRLLVALW